ncbi:MAG: acetyltransferase [Sulfuricurvum sp.]|nr:acetyltransferase [Sulfuricurvum sp.]
MAENNIYIYGASGHGKVIADIIQASGFTLCGWIDDDKTKNCLSWDDFCALQTQANIALGIGSNHIRAAIAKKIKLAGYKLPVLIHPSAIVSPSAILKEATVVMPLCVINADTKIATGAIVNSGSIIEHDCYIGEYVHISPNSSIAGNVTIGNYTHIGIGTSIIQGITIGEESVIGAGATVICNLPSHITAVGTPAKIIKGLS